MCNQENERQDVHGQTTANPSTPQRADGSCAPLDNGPVNGCPLVLMQLLCKAAARKRRRSVPPQARGVAMKTLIRSLSLLTAVTLVGCSDPAADWSVATGQGTAAAYQTFLNKYPNDPHAADARQRVESIHDGEAWIAAQTANSVASYQQYIATEPHGVMLKAAQDQITAIHRTADWQDAKNA